MYIYICSLTQNVRHRPSFTNIFLTDAGITLLFKIRETSGRSTSLRIPDGGDAAAVAMAVDRLKRCDFLSGRIAGCARGDYSHIKQVR